MINIRLTSYYKPCPIEEAPMALSGALLDTNSPPFRYEGLRQALIDEHGYDAFFEAQSKAFKLITLNKNPHTITSAEAIQKVLGQ
jgi:hypothetical protein